MSETLADPILDALVGDFGGNYFFALDLLEDFRKDPGSVDPSWREYFARITGAPPSSPKMTTSAGPNAVTPATVEPAVNPAPAPAVTAPVQLVRTETQAVAVPKSKALAAPAILPGDIAQPIRGGAMRIVENMEASLTVPTATSIRTVPVRTLEENRAILNKHRAAQG